MLAKTTFNDNNKNNNIYALVEDWFLCFSVWLWISSRNACCCHRNCDNYNNNNNYGYLWAWLEGDVPSTLHLQQQQSDGGYITYIYI